MTFELNGILFLGGDKLTAEVAIINRHAIALAADSAVTVDDGYDQKVFTSSNKIFQLTKKLPIGIMIYGVSDFMGVPWETIIKNFRSDFADEFDTVDECEQEFIKYIKSSRIVSESLYLEYVANRVSGVLDEIIASYIFNLEQVLAKVESISIRDMKSIFRESLNLQKS